jgi:hypothetical protein
MTLPMADMPAAISESIAVTLKAHGLSLSPDILREIGNNTTQALCALDVAIDVSDAPPAAELLAVAETMRSLAQAGRPNHDTAVALARVGSWLRDVARDALADGKAA